MIRLRKNGPLGSELSKVLNSCYKEEKNTQPERNTNDYKQLCHLIFHPFYPFLSFECSSCLFFLSLLSHMHLFVVTLLPFMSSQHDLKFIMCLLSLCRYLCMSFWSFCMFFGGLSISLVILCGYIKVVWNRLVILLCPFLPIGCTVFV